MTIATTSPAVPNGATIGTEPREARETRDLLRGDDDGPGDRSSRHLRFSKVGLDVFDRLLQLLDRPPLARAAHVRDLRQDVDSIAGKILGQIVHLPRQTPAGQTEDREHQRRHCENGWDAADPTLEPGDGRSQHEREKDGECDRNEHGLCPVQDDNDEHTAGERYPRFQGLRRVIHEPQPILDCARRQSTLPCSERYTHPSSSHATLPYRSGSSQWNYDRRRRGANARQSGDNMDTNTLLIILVLLLVLGGGGFFYRRRV